MSHGVDCQLPPQVSDSVRHWEFLRQKFSFWLEGESNTAKGKLLALSYYSQMKIGTLPY